MYDYIIVGAGSAGCVLANRLSADPRKRVCLVEAGQPDKNPLLHMPLGLAVLARNRSINWGYQTSPQTQLNGRSLYWPRGKTLGGSSSINAMIYMRGHPADYQAWQQATGTDAWGWNRAKALFREMENNHRFGATEEHGGAGELHVSDLSSVNPLSHAFVAAAAALQIPLCEDFNGAEQEGAGIYQVTQHRGRRWSAARAFLRPVLGRPNLELKTGAQVLRVLLQERRARGVVLRHAKRDEQLLLREGGEVLLSGGAINSPQLLMLSGIGSAPALSALGITPVHDLAAVGQNLQDHLDITLMHTANTRQPIGVAPGFLPRAMAGLWHYWRKGTGELTSNVAEAGGFVKSDARRARPNLQFHFLPAYLRDHGRKLSFGYGYTLHVCDLQPQSRGEITLASPDPMAAPRIDPRYLSAPEDIATLLDALKIGRRVLASPPLAALSRAERLPGARLHSDAELIEDIRARAETIYHPAGTCRMGQDRESVVDPELRVRGVAGLRVIDASVMPNLIAGNTNAPTMMIAQNAAEMMLGKYPSAPPAPAF